MSDVHGASVDSSQIASNLISITVLNAQGEKITYKENDPNHPLPFFRNSLGLLGVVTAATFKIIPRNNRDAITPAQHTYSINTTEQFADIYNNLLFNNQYNAVETFYNPYSKNNNFLTLLWTINNKPIAKQKTITDRPLIYAHLEGCN